MLRLTRLGLVVVTLACLSSAGRAQQASSAVGLWASEGYGFVFDVRRDSVLTYQVTKISCIPDLHAVTIPAPAGALGAFRLPNASVTFLINPGKTRADARVHVSYAASDMIIHRIDRKPATCDAPTPDTPRSNFDVFARTWAEQYGFFAEKKVDWTSVVAANRSRVTVTTTAEQLFDILSGMIAPLQDAHSYLVARAIDKRFGGVRRTPSFLERNDRDAGYALVSAHLAGPLRTFCHGQVEFGMLDTDVGYLRIRSFNGYAPGGFEAGLAALDAALDTAFANTRGWKGLVIDVRLNNGGADPYGLAIARRLTSAPYTAYVKQARSDPDDPTKWTAEQPSVVQPTRRPSFYGPVIELTGVQSISAAETFTQALMDRKPKVIRVGETTQGVFSDVLQRTLPNGWEFGLANERFVTDGKSYDNVGIAPDVAVESFTPAARATHRDAAVETALAILAGKPGGTLEAGALPASVYAGGADCGGAPRFRVHAYNADFYILRQPACTNFEKPFLYLLFGRERALLFDTGAGHVDVVTPVDTLVRAWLARHGRVGGSMPLVVAHSHGHGDHVAGDSLFAARPNTAVVGRDTASVRTFFGIAQWPNDAAMIDLGGRVIDVLPIPGHQAASIALYDRQTGVLLTGDTFYPGRLYVRDTAAFAVSIHRLAEFTRTHPVVHLLGAHVENTSTPYRDYPEGTVDQPEEHALALGPAELFELDSVVRSMRGRMTRTALRDVTVWPLPP